MNKHKPEYTNNSNDKMKLTGQCFWLLDFQTLKRLQGHLKLSWIYFIMVSHEHTETKNGTLYFKSVISGCQVDRSELVMVTIFNIKYLDTYLEGRPLNMSARETSCI